MSDSSSSGPIASANNLALEILQALGIPSRRAVSVTLACDAGDVARLRVEYLVDGAFPAADLMAALVPVPFEFATPTPPEPESARPPSTARQFDLRRR